jgi:predicted DNA-binding protein (MmcQ/YjbR family)
MNIEEYRNYCLSKKMVTEGFPFDANTLVYKVCGKIFTITDLELFISINLKCDPELAMELRDQFEAVQPGYHMNKKHWNTVIMDNTVSNKLIYQWINHSYDLVVKSLSKKDQKIYQDNSNDE